MSEDKGLNKDVKGRVIGVSASSRTLDFLFFLELGLLIYGQTDTLSQTMQAECMTLLCGNQLYTSTLNIFLGNSTQERFQLFYEKVLKRAGKYDSIGNHMILRRKKTCATFSTLSALLKSRVTLPQAKGSATAIWFLITVDFISNALTR